MNTTRAEHADPGRAAHWICRTCGTQFAASAEPPARCPICADERQYVGPRGQEWTTLEALRRDHANRIEEDGGIVGIGTEPEFAIAQRALLVRTPAGNVLWDCVTLVDDATVDAVEGLGGIDAIAISHPHYYSSVVEWSRAFGGAPVLLHEADREWVMRPDRAIEHWSGDRREILPGLTLHRLGGHFPGSTVLHWAEGAGGEGALLTGDTIQVVLDRRWVSFMYSYPNQIPLPASEVRRIGEAVEPLAFERLYGAWWGRNVLADAKGAVRRSVARYLAALEDRPRPLAVPVA